ncbi:hypothetical protein ACJPQX_20755 [Vibrio vulnificus]|uniref:hypothetical protein n=1 Tax=Vibrio vulnificus TaxID=672 RepID=UPI003D9CA36C
MAKQTKQPYQEQVDKLCQELGITEKQYNANTTIPELEAIIDKLEAQLPDVDTDSGEENAEKHASGNDEIEISMTDLPDGAEIDESLDLQVEVNGDDEGNLEVKAVSTFRCRVNDERITVLAGQRKLLPEDVAMDAVGIGVAVLIGSVK